MEIVGIEIDHGNGYGTTWRKRKFRSLRIARTWAKRKHAMRNSLWFAHGVITGGKVVLEVGRFAEFAAMPQ